MEPFEPCTLTPGLQMGRVDGPTEDSAANCTCKIEFKIRPFWGGQCRTFGSFTFQNGRQVKFKTPAESGSDRTGKEQQMAGKVETVISVNCMDCGRSGHHAKDCPPKATEVTEELLRTKKMSGAERAAHPMCTSGMLTRHSGSWTTDCGENCDCSDPGRGGCYCVWCSDNTCRLELRAHWDCCGCEDKSQPYCLRNHLFSSDQLKRVANCASALCI
jgi:hypothetical protein